MRSHNNKIQNWLADVFTSEKEKPKDPEYVTITLEELLSSGLEESELAIGKYVKTKFRMPTMGKPDYAIIARDFVTRPFELNGLINAGLSAELKSLHEAKKQEIEEITRQRLVELFGEENAAALATAYGQEPLHMMLAILHSAFPMDKFLIQDPDSVGDYTKANVFMDNKQIYLEYAVNHFILRDLESCAAYKFPGRTRVLFKLIREPGELPCFQLEKIETKNPYIPKIIFSMRMEEYVTRENIVNKFMKPENLCSESKIEIQERRITEQDALIAKQNAELVKLNKQLNDAQVKLHKAQERVRVLESEEKNELLQRLRLFV